MQLKVLFEVLYIDEFFFQFGFCGCKHFDLREEKNVCVRVYMYPCVYENGNGKLKIDYFLIVFGK